MDAIIAETRRDAIRGLRARSLTAMQKKIHAEPRICTSLEVFPQPVIPAKHPEQREGCAEPGPTQQRADFSHGTAPEKLDFRTHNASASCKQK
jgi:hypothetical protein